MAEYTAKKDLYIGFTKARNKGSKVSAEDVKKYGWEDGVEKTESAPRAGKPAEEKKD